MSADAMTGVSEWFPCQTREKKGTPSRTAQPCIPARRRDLTHGGRHAWLACIAQPHCCPGAHLSCPLRPFGPRRMLSPAFRIVDGEGGRQPETRPRSHYEELAGRIVGTGF